MKRALSLRLAVVLATIFPVANALCGDKTTSDAKATDSVRLTIVTASGGG